MVRVMTPVGKSEQEALAAELGDTVRCGDPAALVEWTAAQPLPVGEDPDALDGIARLDEPIDVLVQADAVVAERERGRGSPRDGA